MTFIIAILRLLHIVSAFMWFGLGAATTLYIVPAATEAGENGMRYMKTLYTNTQIVMAVPIAAGLTALAGILLYLTGDTNNNFSTTGKIVLGIGALLGFLAMIHGGAVTQRTTRKFSATLTQYAADSQPIAAEGLRMLREQAMKLAADSRISFALMVIALLCMGTARYL